MSETEDGLKEDVTNGASTPKTSKMSGSSAALIEEGLSLLNMHSSATATIRPVSPELISYARSSSPDFGLSSHTLAKVRTPQFKRIDFDDRLEDLNERKPAWKSLEENITDSYHTAKRSAARTKDENEFINNTFTRPRRREGVSPFRNLELETGFVPSVRSRSSLLSPSLSNRSRLATSASSATLFNAGSGPYAAPALGISQGIESRYEERANNVELMLLKTAPLPQHYKSVTTREFRRAPEPASGSASEKDDYDFSMYTPKPYYSRPNRDDPDYFDFDLQHSVDLFKRPEGKYTPKGPQDWESKLVKESTGKGSTALSGYMFTKGDSDWRNNNSSYLSAALRTPKFWEQRFESIGKSVRESNPISLESINRNRPVPSRFTEYRDPDFEDYDED